MSCVPVKTKVSKSTVKRAEKLSTLFYKDFKAEFRKPSFLLHRSSTLITSVCMIFVGYNLRVSLVPMFVIVEFNV
jgi:predicted permease